MISSRSALPGHDIIVMGASSGGIQALIEVVSGLPKNLPAALFVVLHVPARSKSELPQILNRAGPLPAKHAIDNEAIVPGRIYVAPPDLHLLLKDGRTRLVRGPKESNTRPAVDPLFRSAARDYGPRVIGVVLSGALDDGTAGLVAIKKRGGVAIVQDPADAVFPDMPRNAMEAAPVDHCLPVNAIAQTLARLAREPAKEAAAVPEAIEKETAIEELDMNAIEDEDRPGNPSVYGCPDCGGVLWEIEEGDRLRFRCRVGHAYGGEGLLASQSESLDTALWSAFRALEENAGLARRLAARARQNKRGLLVKNFEQKAQAAEEQAAVIRRLLLSDKLSAPVDKAQQT
jgi:two-component system chemotaxis response regulator CheB